MSASREIQDIKTNSSQPRSSYLKLNELELQELEMDRDLLRKLINANLLQLTDLAERLKLNEELVANWVAGHDHTVIIINQRFYPITDYQNNQLSINCLRSSLQSIHEQLESMAEQHQHTQETLDTVTAVLNEWHVLSQNHEHRVQQFKQLLQACNQKGFALELKQITSPELQRAASDHEWVKVNVVSLDERNNKVTLQKSNGDLIDVDVACSSLRIPDKSKLSASLPPINHDLPFQPHMTRQEASKLNVNDSIDYRDNVGGYVGKFVLAKIMEKNGSKLKIHYDGWSSKWDICSDYETELYRFAKAGTVSQRPAHRFKELNVGDKVNINPREHLGWKSGVIKRFDGKSGQVQVCNACIIW